MSDNLEGCRPATDYETAALRNVDRANSAVDRVIEIAGRSADLFHDLDRASYASMNQNGHREIWPLRSAGFENWLRGTYYAEVGKGLSRQNYETALATLQAKAVFGGTTCTVHMRTARSNNNYFIDLCDADWRVVKIGPEGWCVIDQTPVPFVRHDNMRPLPCPERGGDLAMLWSGLNVPEALRPLVLAWTLECFRPDTVYPVLEIVAEQGCGKSYTQRHLRDLIDPNKVSLRRLPRQPEDLFVTASRALLVSLENVSQLSDDMQDTLCSLATGGGFATRELYTNGNEFALATKAPIVMNGIAILATRPDLIDRVIHIELPHIDPSRRCAEAELDCLWEAQKPKIFGALLDRFVRALRILPQISLPELPRLADFATFGEAVSRAGGAEPGSFIADFESMRVRAVNRTIEGDTIGLGLLALMDRCSGRFEGTLSALLRELREGSVNPEIRLPLTPRGLSDRLRRLAPALRVIGIEVLSLGHFYDGSRVLIQRHEQVETANSSTSSDRQESSYHSNGRAHAYRDATRGF